MFRRVEIFKVHNSGGRWQGVMMKMPAAGIAMLSMEEWGIFAEYCRLCRWPELPAAPPPEFWFTEFGYQQFKLVEELFLRVHGSPSPENIRIREAEDFAGAHVYRDEHQVAIVY